MKWKWGQAAFSSEQLSFRAKRGYLSY